MKRRDYTLRLWFLLVFAFLLTAILYFLPNEVAGVKLKRVDLLAHLRNNDNDPQGDFLTANEIFNSDSLANEHLAQQQDSLTEQEAYEAHVRDSLYNALVLDESTTTYSDSTDTNNNPILIKDFSPQHNALIHTYKAIAKQEPLRIAFLGDSFIEGDIFTLDVRKKLQQKFGGAGVGWMPMASNVASFRRGIKHTFTGWKTKSAINHKNGRYFFGESIYSVSDSVATLSYTFTNEFNTPKQATIFYSSVNSVPFSYTVNDSVYTDNLTSQTPIGAYTLALKGHSIKLRFPNRSGLCFYGITFDNSDEKGVIVDNFSLRGSSGISLITIDPEIASRMNSLRHYNLIVLQFGLNVIENTRFNYTNYARKMVDVVQTLKGLFPTSDILIMGVSDRGGTLDDGTKGTLRATLALREAIKSVAQATAVAYWDTYLAMKKAGGIVQFVNEGMAAKDYTHLSFKGGRYLAEQFVDSFLLEKGGYSVSAE